MTKEIAGNILDAFINSRSYRIPKLTCREFAEVVAEIKSMQAAV